MKQSIFCILFFIVFSCSKAQPSFVKDSLESYIQKGLADWNIPGLAIVIIKDGKVVVRKGFGVSDIERKTPVTENTLFMIASNSKLFTGTALAQLEYDKKLSLNDKITKYFPGYKLYDKNTTELVTIKDMLSHKLGTKTFQGDFTFWDVKLTRNDIINKMQHLKPQGLYRQDFGYCNSCFLTAGEVIPRVTGKPWEVYIYDSILAPLGMVTTQALGRNMDKMPYAAKPYTTSFSKEIQELPYNNVDNLAPAGSMVSNVKDLTSWLMMQLDSGRYNGKVVLPWSVLRRTRDMSTAISSRKSATKPTHFSGYGLGIFISDYNGKQVFSHTGGAFGFVTNTCFVPEENLGIAILTNQDNQNFFEALRFQILDAYLGVPYVNRSLEQLAGFNKEQQSTLQQIDAFKKRVRGKLPAISLASYAGDYMHELYGSITISEEENNLKIIFNQHNDLIGSLQYMDNDEWLMTYSNIDFGIFSTKFKIENKKVISIDIKASDFVEYDPYTFIKK